MTVAGPTLTGGALCYRSGFKIDADGAPDAYSWDDTGRDYLENAHGPGGHVSRGDAAKVKWFGVATNAMGVPVEQGPSDPCPGRLVSTTALQDPSKAVTDPRRYVDSRVVPYVSVARDLLGRPAGVRMGDLAWVLYHGMEWGAVVADVGPAHQYGEGSIALADYLSIPSSCRWRTQRSGVDATPGGGPVTWIIFPGSAVGWPKTPDEVVAAAQSRFIAWGSDFAAGAEAKAAALWPGT